MYTSMNSRGVLLLLLSLSVLCATKALDKDLELQTELEAASSSQNNERAPVCPGGGICNNHGSCLTGVCTCYSGWAGDDCSYAIATITSGVPLLNQHVDNKQWQYYNISVSGSGLLVVVNQTNGGDVDMYLLQGDFPTRVHYSQRDVSSITCVHCMVPNPAPGTWYIGIFGYLSTNYIISATVSASSCPAQNNCNPPHGTCVGAATCQCASGWAGSDCSLPVNSISLSQQYNATVASKAWVYYTVTITSGKALSLDVYSATGDVDVYVKFGGTPDIWHYDYRDTSAKKNFSIQITSPQMGAWFLGFYGFSESSYSFTIQTSNRCPNNCSQHGTCSTSGSCQCSSGYDGTYCQNKINAMQLGATYTGFVDTGSWNYFFVTAQSEANLVISVQEFNEGDCDLYVKQGTQPTKTVYDYKHIGTSATYQLTIPNPTGTWNIGVYGFSTCAYSITVNIKNTCPDPTCSGHGTCTAQGSCACNDGYVGLNCSTVVTPITSGATIYPAAVHLNGWNYYSLSVVNTSFVAIGIKETSTEGFLWLFASKESAPDLRNYDYADQDTNSKYHSLDIPFNQPQTTTYIIGVYADPFAERGPISYSIDAWYSPF